MKRITSLLALLAMLGLSAPAFGQYDYQTADDEAGFFSEEFSDIEYEPDEGYHEEEWYDPSDWFDADAGIEYEEMNEDQYGYYDTDYSWETNEGWFEGWYGESDDWF